jgi:integrase
MSRSSRASNGNAEQLHDYVLFSANTGLRPDEARRLQFRDVTNRRRRGERQTILEIEVRGKRGVGYCKSMTGAVRPFERLKARLRPRGYDPGRPSREGVEQPMANRMAMAPAATDRPHFSEMAARAVQDDSGRENLRVRSRRPAARPTACGTPTSACA